MCSYNLIQVRSCQHIRSKARHKLSPDTYRPETQNREHAYLKV